MRVRIRETDFELELTAFINLMIVLLAFLLMSSVVKEVAALQVNLPASGGPAGADQKKPPIVLEVIVYKDKLMVTDRQSGPLKELPNAGNDHDYAGLTSFLKQIKQQYPAITEASILLEQDTAYEDLIHTMDATRYYVDDISGNPIKRSLFPDIAIGDAPQNGRS